MWGTTKNWQELRNWQIKQKLAALTPPRREVKDTGCTEVGRAIPEARSLVPQPASIPSGKGSNEAQAPPLPGEKEIVPHQTIAGGYSLAR